MATLDADVTIVPAKEPSSSAAPSSSTKKPKRFEIKKWHAVALWEWDVQSCWICKNNIDEPCIRCVENQAIARGEKCSVVWGACNHGFHFHCINRWWSDVRKVCPIDSTKWKFRN